jgi:hypothetical protein
MVPINSVPIPRSRTVNIHKLGRKFEAEVADVMKTATNTEGEHELSYFQVPDARMAEGNVCTIANLPNNSSEFLLRTTKRAENTNCHPPSSCSMLKERSVRERNERAHNQHPRRCANRR